MKDVREVARNTSDARDRSSEFQVTPSEAAVRMLTLAVPATQVLLDDHVSTHGELLPTVYLGELADSWYLETTTPSRSHSLHALAEALECLVTAGVPDVKDLVTTGFLEGLPPSAGREPQVLGLLGPNLRAELKRVSGDG